MNKYYNYKDKFTWDPETWEGDRQGFTAELFKWVVENNDDLDSDHQKAIDCSPWEGYSNPDTYNSKNFSMNVPAIMDYWEEKGLRYESRSIGNMRWISMVPSHAYDEPEKKLPALYVVHNEDYSYPWWAMRTLEYFRDYNEMAIKEDMIIIYLASDKLDRGQCPNILLESNDLFPVDINRCYFDMSTAVRKGVKPSQIPGFKVNDKAGNPVDVDSLMETVSELNIPVINIGHLWQKRDCCYLFLGERMGNAAFDLNELIHTEAGRKMAEGSYFEYAYDNGQEPELFKYWDDMGLRYEIHDYRGERWFTMVPKCAFDEPEKKLPIMVILQETGYYNDHVLTTAFSQFLDYCKMAAQGDMILLFYARESPDLLEVLVDILGVATDMYPIDRSRVYMTGHSHNGYYSIEFARRHPDLIAAVATLGDLPGLADPADYAGPLPFTDERIETLSQHDIPLINISGYMEPRCMFPVGADAVDVYPGRDARPTEKERRAVSWQRRLKAMRCPMKTLEEIYDSVNSPDYVTRMLGVPCDKTDVIYADGFDHYIGDFKNVDGKYHFRIVAIENMPHLPTPFMNVLAWSYVKRFSRDQKTGEISESCW